MKITTLRSTHDVYQVAGLLTFALWMLWTVPAVGQLGSPFGRGAGPAAPPGPSEPDRYQAIVFQRREAAEPVVAVKITGNRVVDDGEIRQKLQTRVGRDYDPETVRSDVRRLSSTGMFRNVQTYRKKVDGGVEVTFEVYELPLISHLNFVGNEQVKTKVLREKAELSVGDPLQRYRVEEAKRKVEAYYLEKGYSDAQVQIQEGIEPGDDGVVLSIYEGVRQRVAKVEFVGNTIASDARLRTQIEAKPGILWVWKGEVDMQQIDLDQQRLTAYYRSLGFFRARIGRELEWSESGKWLTIRWLIDEGPRYKLRNVSLVGNKTFTTESLAARLELKSGEHFDAKKMNRDLQALRDAYGSKGYIHADIQADPRFLEEPGMIDLVYDVEEGDQYRVGRIIVNIDGENPHTRRNVVINRLSLSPNEVIDLRELRNSERRLSSSQLFLSDPARGVSPSIEVRPPEQSRLRNAHKSSSQPPWATRR